MGTFVIRPTELSSGGTPLIDGNDTPADEYGGWVMDTVPPDTILDAMLDALNDHFMQVVKYTNAAPGSYNNTLRFNCIGDCIYLDGSLTPISYNTLPAGFNPLTASVEIDIAGTSVPGGGGVANYFLQQGIIGDGPVNTNSFPYEFTPIPPTMLAIVNNGMGLKINLTVDTNPDVGSIGSVFNFRIEGTYEISSFSVTLDPIPTPPIQRIQISISSLGPEEGGMDLSQLITDYGDGMSGINIQYTDHSGPDPVIITINIPTINILFISETSMIFSLPDVFPFVNEDMTVIVTGNGQQFSGTVSLGVLQILNEDASGIYKIVKNKTCDTFYDRSSDTMDVMIPQPLIRTGYIGG